MQLCRSSISSIIWEALYTNTVFMVSNLSSPRQCSNHARGLASHLAMLVLFKNVVSDEGILTVLAGSKTFSIMSTVAWVTWSLFFWTKFSFVPTSYTSLLETLIISIVSLIGRSVAARVGLLNSHLQTYFLFDVIVSRNGPTVLMYAHTDYYNWSRINPSFDTVLQTGFSQNVSQSTLFMRWSLMQNFIVAKTQFFYDGYQPEYSPLLISLLCSASNLRIASLVLLLLP